jgi:ribose transport system substrate-binding protein
MEESSPLSTPLSRRTFLGAFTAVAGSGLLAACGSSGSSSMPQANGKTKGFNIAVEDGYTGNTWRTQTNTDMKREAAKLKKQGLIGNFKLLTSPNDASTQLTHIQSMIADKPDAILFAPVTNASAQTAAARMKAAGIPAYVIVDPAPTADALNVVGGDNTWWEIQTKWLVGELNGKGKILMVTGLAGNG